MKFKPNRTRVSMTSWTTKKKWFTSWTKTSWFWAL